MKPLPFLPPLHQLPTPLTLPLPFSNYLFNKDYMPGLVPGTE